MFEKKIWFLLIILGLILPACYSSSHAVMTAVAYEPLSTTAPWRFRVAFWSDPDLSPPKIQSLREKVAQLSSRMVASVSSDLVACGFGDMVVYLIDDYDELREELRKGDFHLLHCDQATYVLGVNTPILEGQPWTSYQVIAEEKTNPDSPEEQAAVWVHKDSLIQSLSELKDKQIAMVHRLSLWGGAMQYARLSSLGIRENRNVTLVNAGSVSDALLRLLTGLGEQQAVEAAFLPLHSPGFDLIQRALKKNDLSELPIRIIDQAPIRPVPGKPLLVDGRFLAIRPELGDKLVSFLERQSQPWRWTRSEEERFLPLLKDLQPLVDSLEETDPSGTSYRRSEPFHPAGIHEPETAP